MIKKCKICSKEFKTFACIIKAGKGKFCSRPCYIIDWNKRIPGWNKNKQSKWMIGNQLRKGKPNLNPNKMFGKDNPQWKQNKVGYRALHYWQERQLGKPTQCEFCLKDNLTGKQIHWANKSHKYLRDKNDWLRLCVKCHKKYDCKLIDNY